MEKLEKQQLGRPTEGFNNNSTMYIMKTGYEGQSWLELAENIQWWVLSVAMKLWDFLHTYIYIETFLLPTDAHNVKKHRVIKTL